MIEALFTELAKALGGSFWLAFLASFGWGILSILLSPCHLTSIPLVIGYISVHGRVKTNRSFLLSLVFAVGILLTIALIGLITASMGRMLGDIGNWGAYLVAAVFILMGLYLMDVIRWNWDGLSISDEQRGGLWGAFVLGLVFGVGLGPCTFAFLAPVLGVVFQMASESWLNAVLLIGAFGIGHSVVIVVAGSLASAVQRYLNWIGKNSTMVYVKRTAGALVFVGGLYFFYTTI
ncbi:MAG: cytochrome C biogenesis protein [Chlorobiales bacterium]|nr:cytochrome C biogenesis protein [Chlorobiales bacterium]